MGPIKWDMLGFAVLGALAIAGVGIAIGEKSWIIAIICLIALVISMRAGFRKGRQTTTKKR